jgi:Cobalamin biosynthesis protein CobN and related Mg-chelatases
MKTRLFFGLFIFSIMFPSIALSGGQISFLACDSDTYLINNALKSLQLPEEIQVRYFSEDDIRKEKPAREFITASDVIIVDVMINGLTEHLINKTDYRRKRLYAVRSSRDDEGLKKKGFIFDPEIQEYFNNLSAANIRNMIYRVANMEFDKKVPYAKVKKMPPIGIYHPGSRELFTEIEKYLAWYKRRKGYASQRPWQG